MGVIIQRIEPANRAGAVIGAPITDIPDPKKYTWSKNDISGQDAGRVITGDAIKLKVGEARVTEFTFNGDVDTVAAVFTAFNHEYLWMTYFDAMAGGYVRKHFYIGDYSAELKALNNRLQFWEDVKIKCIQSTIDKT